MAVLVLLVLILAITSHTADGNWCICRSDVSSVALQNAIDYACGNGADCKPILQNGACYQPNDVKTHCSYAVNSYFQRKNQGPGTCDFSGSTTPVTTDPSPDGTCTFPATPSAAGGGGGGGVTVNPPGTRTPSTTTTPGINGPPSTLTPTNGGFTPTLGGGGINGLGPTGAGFNTDSSSDGGFTTLQNTKFLSFLLQTVWFSTLIFLCL